jgi:ketosteroid isomerase-like protein
MKALLLPTMVSLILMSGCHTKPQEDRTEQWKQEIRETEQAFSDLSEKEGIARAFLTYAAEDAVLMRNNQLFEGRVAIAKRFEENQPYLENVTLTWKPDFVEVSASGDLGYTYGSYTMTTADSLGNKSQLTGIFHTVWRRQTDGAWRFVWD